MAEKRKADQMGDESAKRAPASQSIARADIIEISVGGTAFLTTRETLCSVPDSLLAKMFTLNSPFGEPTRDPSTNAYFIDRDPESFAFVLDFLRRGGRMVGVPETLSLLERVEDDADFFGLQGLAQASKVARKTISRKNQLTEANTISPRSIASAVAELCESIGNICEHPSFRRLVEYNRDSSEALRESAASASTLAEYAGL